MARTTRDDVPAVRSVALVGHPGAGKTSLAEILLHAAGVVRRPGAVDEGTALLGARAGGPDGGEAGWAWLDWQEARIHLVDTPGAPAAHAVARLAQVGADVDLVAVSAPDGVERGTEDALETARRDGRPVIAVLTKVDRGVELDRLVADVGAAAGRPAVALQVPLCDRDRLVGVVDLLGGVARRYADDGSGAWSPEPVAAADRERVRAARERLTEAVALTDDALLEAYLEHLELPDDTAWDGLARAVAASRVVPVLLTSAARHVGAHGLLDGVVRLVPPAAPIRAEAEVVAQWVGAHLDADGARVTHLRVLKGTLRPNTRVRNARTGETTRLRKLYVIRGPRRARAQTPDTGAILATWDPVPGRPGDTFADGPVAPCPVPRRRPPMAWLTLAPRGRADVRTLTHALHRVATLDPGLEVAEPEDGTVEIAGSTRAQLDRVVRLLGRRFGLQVAAALPPVRYVERPVHAVSGVSGRHARPVDGEMERVGEVVLDITLSAPTAPFRFEGRVDELRLPAHLVPPAGDGVRRALLHGPTAGYPVIGVSACCIDGDYDILASTEEDLAAAGEDAMRRALMSCGTELLEPWTDLEVVVPSGDVGTVLAELGARRARVVALEAREEGRTSIEAHCPDIEVRTLGTRLETLTQGRGWFTARARFYDRLPHEFVDEAVAASPHRTAGASPRVRAR